MQKNRGPWRLLLLPLVALMLQSSARAQTPPAPQPSTEDAKKIYDDAVSFYALGRYAEAAPLFERAFEIKHVPALLFNAAQAHRFAGHTARALALYESYLRLYGDPERKAEIEAHIAELRSTLAAHPEAATTPPPGGEATSAPPPVVTTPAPASASTSSSPSTSPSTEALTASAPPKKPPLVKRPWFWVAVGGGAVVIAGVIVGIAVGTRGHQSPPASFGTVNGN